MPGQECLSHSIEITPTAALIHDRVDYFGNHVRFFSLQQSHESLVVAALSEVRVEPPARPPLAESISWLEAQQAFTEEDWKLDPHLQEFIYSSPSAPRTAEMAQYAEESFAPDRPLLECVADLTARIHEEFIYDPRATNIATPLEEVWKERRGVCQDFAHLEIACLRSLGIPARYVSGYLETTPPPGKPRLIGADASHAWLSVYCPGRDWCDFDPTNNLVPSSRHITLAWGRDFTDVSPLRGVILGGNVQVLKVSVDVAPAEPEPVAG